MSFHHQTRANQRGSALLIVFVFAAIVAIMLFTQMPIVIFEAQRSKEQLLIDRGNEYTQAVKIYLRKTGQYPPSIDALENTNRVRFLRKKFKDPFTDKADWRLLHAGPNGILIDSKIKQLQTSNGPNSSLGTFNNNGNNQSSPFGSTSTFGGGGTFGNANSGNFGSNNSGSNNSGFNNGGNANGFGGGNAPNPITTNQPPANVRASNGAENPLFQGGVVSNPQGIDPNQLPTQAQMANGLAQAAAQNPNGTNSVGAQNSSVPRSIFPVGTNGSATGVIDPSQVAGGFASSSGVQNPSDANNPNAAVAGLVSNPNAPTAQTNGFSSSSGQGGSAFGNNSFGNNPSGNTSFGNNPSGNTSFGNNPSGNNSFGNSTGGNSFGSSSTNNAGNANAPGGFGSSTFGNTQNGNLAGVASKVERHSIKSVNDQKDYSLWEFYYDQSKDPARNGAALALSQGGTGSPGQPGNSTTQPGAAFGQQNSFGNQSSSSGNRSGSFGNQAGGFGNQGTNGTTNSGFGNFGGGFNGSSNTQSQSGQTATGAQQQPISPPQPPQ